MRRLLVSFGSLLALAGCHSGGSEPAALTESSTCADAGLSEIAYPSVNDLAAEIAGMVRGGSPATEVERAVNQRAVRLHQLALRDPRAALRAIREVPVTEEAAGRYGSRVTRCLERPVRRAGKAEILGETGGDDPSGIHYFLREAGGRRHRVYFAATPALRGTGEELEVKGYELPCGASALGSSQLGPGDLAGLPAEALYPDPILADAASGPSFSSVSGAQPLYGTQGAQPVASILVNFQDLSGAPSAGLVQQLVYSQVDGFWREASFGQTWVTGQVFGPFTIPMSSTACDIMQLATQAQAAARAAGIDLSSYQRYVYFFPRNTSCGTWLGMGTIGGNPSQAWINGSAVFHTTAHEMGHNLGLYHANGLDCGSTTIGSSCSVVEYADPADVMGTQEPGAYNAFHKEQLGWLNTAATPPISLVETTGTYLIEPFETASTGVKGLKILKSAVPNGGERIYYYLEYRQPSGYDDVLSGIASSNNLTTGVLVHTGSDSVSNSSNLLKMNPQYSSWFQAGLNPGQAFQDPDAGVELELVSANASGAVINITFGSSGAPPVTGAGDDFRIVSEPASIAAGKEVDLRLIGELAGVPLAGASYQLTITSPGGTQVTRSGSLDQTGVSDRAFLTQGCAERGVYQARVEFSSSSRTYAASTSFTVQ